MQEGMNFSLMGELSDPIHVAVDEESKGLPLQHVIDLHWFILHWLILQLINHMKKNPDSWQLTTIWYPGLDPWRDKGH